MKLALSLRCLLLFSAVVITTTASGAEPSPPRTLLTITDTQKEVTMTTHYSFERNATIIDTWIAVIDQAIRNASFPLDTTETGSKFEWYDAAVSCFKRNTTRFFKIVVNTTLSKTHLSAQTLFNEARAGILANCAGVSFQNCPPNDVLREWQPMIAYGDITNTFLAYDVRDSLESKSPAEQDLSACTKPYLYNTVTVVDHGASDDSPLMQRLIPWLVIVGLFLVVAGICGIARCVCPQQQEECANFCNSKGCKDCVDNMNSFNRSTHGNSSRA